MPRPAIIVEEMKEEDELPRDGFLGQEGVNASSAKINREKAGGLGT